jgi:hypothetical protein
LQAVRVEIEVSQDLLLVEIGFGCTYALAEHLDEAVRWGA